MPRSLGRTANRVCQVCSSEFYATRSGRHKALFCSRSCAGVASRRNEGEGPVGRRGYRGAKWKEISGLVRLRDDNKCRNCGDVWSGTGNAWPVDHVRPWRTFSDLALANHPDNLVLLCHSCHSRKTHSIERMALGGDWSILKKWAEAVAVSVPDPEGEIARLAAHKVARAEIRICWISDCESNGRKRGLCETHYSRLKTIIRDGRGPVDDEKAVA